MKTNRESALRPTWVWPQVVATVMLTVVMPGAGWPVLAQNPGELEKAPDLEVLDRVVAVVNDDPILLSEVRRRVALARFGSQTQTMPGVSGSIPRGQTTEDESSSEQERSVLSALIEERLLEQEAERYGIEPIRRTEVDREVAQQADALGGRAELERALAETGMTWQELEQSLARQIRILRLIEQRLGPRVFVDVDAIRQYYDEELSREMAASLIDNPDAGSVDSDAVAPRPPLDQVREQIREVLYQRGLDRELDLWLIELRRDADVLDLYDREEMEGRGLPPVRKRLTDG